MTGAAVVQENGPERLELKQELLAEVERLAPATALLLSSTSGLMPSDMSARMVEPGRLLVGHPFNPPHVVPLVEVVPGAATTPEQVEAALAFYRALGKQPVALRREIGGFVANRLQSALFRESVHLVLSGVVTAEELDRVVTESVGVRWATAGPFESYSLGGGPGGLRHLLEHLGPGMARRWRDLGEPELTPEVVDRLSLQTEQRFTGRSYEERVVERDRAQLAVLAARRPSGARRTPADRAPARRRWSRTASTGARGAEGEERGLRAQPLIALLTPLAGGAGRESGCAR